MVVYFCYGWKDTAIFSGHLMAVAPAQHGGMAACLEIQGARLGFGGLLRNDRSRMIDANGLPSCETMIGDYQELSITRRKPT
ncbi:hypothetical protein NC652_020691 [Populus alba x Populus x berolinensis]|nr:hypothetical protein NC652_020686 [Populus alba x Populus x berolinensis]KAJ6909775.1 hypothetical protein NC652_020691 [Populus alba x Populus x berolinensis]